MKKITIWGKVTDEGTIIHNHIEDDWVRGDYPSPKKNEYTNQVSWKKSKWKKDFGYIKNVTILVADQKIQER